MLHTALRQFQGLTDMLVLLLLQVTDEQLDAMVSHFAAAAQAAQQAGGGGGDGAHLTLAGFLAASEQSQVGICLTATADNLDAPVIRWWLVIVAAEINQQAIGGKGLHLSSYLGSKD